MNIVQSSSPNFNNRKIDRIDMIVIHYTDTKDIFDSLNILQNPKKEVSAHYLIDEDGTIYQLVDEDMRAWHAGISYWDGICDINSISIGIELQNGGHSFGYKKFPPPQMGSLILLCQDIIKRHKIPKYRILGHSDIAPDRKQDPGFLFDWQLLAQNNIGIWANGKSQALLNTSLKEQLIKFGYNPSLDEKILIDAFKQHFIRAKQQDIAAVLNEINNIKQNCHSNIS